MKKYLSMFMVMTMVLQCTPVAFAGTGGIIYGGKGGNDGFLLLDQTAPAAQINTGKGKGNGFSHHQVNTGKNNGVVNQNIRYQNNKGGKNLNIQAMSPSQMSQYQTMYVLNGIGGVQKYIANGNRNGFPIHQQGQSGQQNQSGQQYQTGNNYEMSDRQFAMMQEQTRYDRQKETMIMQHDWQIQAEDRKLQFVQQQQLQQQALQAQERKQQNNMMLMQMFGGVFSMALMTHQQNKQSRDERRFYESEAQKNRDYYTNLNKYRSRYSTNRTNSTQSVTSGRHQPWANNTYSNQYGQYGQYTR